MQTKLQTFQMLGEHVASHNGIKSMNCLTVTRRYIHFRGTCVDIVGAAKDFQWLPQEGSLSYNIIRNLLIFMGPKI